MLLLTSESLPAHRENTFYFFTNQLSNYLDFFLCVHISSLVVEVSEAYQITCPNPINNCTLWQNKPTLLRTYVLINHFHIQVYSILCKFGIVAQPKFTIFMFTTTPLLN